MEKKNLHKKILGLLIIILAVLNIFMLRLQFVNAEEETTIKVTPILEGALEKYVNYNLDNDDKGTLLQYHLRTGINYKEELEVLPIKENITTINIGQIDGKHPYDVKVIINNTNATNGNADKNIYVDSEYNPDTGILTIKTENQDENGNIISDKIPNKDSRDDYILICYYDTYTNNPVEREIALKVSSRIALFSEKNNELYAEGELKNVLTEDIGDLTSIKYDTEDIYNGYIKSNIINKTEYNTQYKDTIKINVSKKELHQKMQITEKNIFVKTNDEEIVKDLGNDNQLVYKNTKFERQNIIEILGEEFCIEIFDEDGNTVSVIDQNAQFAEDGVITINYENDLTNLHIKMSNIVNEGILNIENTKEIKNTMTDIRNLNIKTITNIIGFNEKQIITQIEENIETQNIEEETYNITKENLVEIKDAQNNVNMTVNSTEWTNEQQNDIIFDINLNSAEIKNNLFKDTSLKIELPSQVEKVILGNSVMVYGNGLTLQEPYTETETNGNISIIANLTGEQTQYQESNLGLITNIKIPVTVILKKDIENITDKLNLVYTNNYTLDKSTEEGNIEIPLNIRSYNAEQNELEEIIQDIELSDKATAHEILDSLKLEVTPVKGDVILNDGDIVYEGEYIKYNIKVTNISNTDIENVKVVANIPEGLVYGELKADYYNYKGEYTYYFDDSIKEKSIDIGTIEAGKTYETFYEVQAQDLENGEEQKEVITDIKTYVGETIATNYQINNIIKPAEVKMFLDARIDNGHNRWNYGLELVGKTGEEAIVQIKLPEEFKLKWFFIEGTEELQIIPNDNIKISEDNIVTAKLTVNDNYFFEGYMEEYEIDKNTNTYIKTIVATAKASVNGKIYTSNENRIEYEYQNATIVMTSPTEGQKINYGEEIQYDIAVTNTGGTKSTLLHEKSVAVHLTDFLPENINPVSVTYETWKQEFNEEDNETEILTDDDVKLIKEEITLDINNLLEDQEGNKLPNVDIICNIPKDETAHIKIIATAGHVFEDTKIENNATITITETISDEDDSIEKVVLHKTSNTIAHIIISEIETDPENPENPEEPDKPIDPDNPDNPNNPSEKNYTISGVAWVDSNEDGARQSTEAILKNIRVILVNMQKANAIDAETVTGENGTYRFTNLKEGNYVVLFVYDNSNYTVTQYKHNGVSENINSDVFEQEIKLFGDKVIVGATDILKVNENKSNIDMGLVENKLFDLSLNKSISMVTVQTKQRTNTYNYQNAKLAKVDIRAKEIEGAKVTVQYKITVTNEGELDATVGNVVDYLPEGFRLDTTNTQLWRNQGNNIVINESIKNQRLPAGESITLTLTATKTMSGDSTGTFINKAEIGQANNSKQIKDIDSTPGNGIETEDDFSKAEIIISIGTGIGVYISIGFILLILLVIALFIGIKKGKINISKFHKISKLSMFAILFVTIIFMQETNSIADRAQNVQYLTSYKDTTFRFNGGVHGVKFTGGPFGSGTCMNSWPSTPNQDKEPPYPREYHLGNEIFTIVSRRTISQGTISLSKGNSSINMVKLDNNYYILGPFVINCNNSNGYNIQVIDKNNKVVSGVSTCNSSGASISVKGNATFYLKIPANACQTGINVVRATNTANVTKVEEVIANVTGEYHPSIITTAQNVSTSGQMTKRITTTTTASASVEWTNFTAVLEIIKQDADNSSVVLPEVRVRVQNTATGYDKTFTTDKNGKIHIDNLSAGTYKITELSNNHYGYAELEIGETTIYYGMIKQYVLKNTKHTGNLQIEKKDSDNSNIKLSGISFRIINQQNSEYVIGKQLDATGNLKPITTATGKVHFDNMETTKNPEEATTFVTDERGIINIYNILTGNYIIEEISVGDNFGYDIDENFISWEVKNSNGQISNIDKSTSAVIEVVRQKSTNTSSSAMQQETSSTSNITAKNERKYIKIRGFAWEDRIDGKDSTKDGKWNDQAEDKRLQNIPVRLYINGNKVDETITDENGEYIFGNYDEDTNALKLKIDDLVGAYIEFEYNGMNYQSIEVNPEFIEQKENISNGNTVVRYTGNGNTVTDEALRNQFNDSYATISKGISSTTDGEKKHNIDYKYDAENHKSHVDYGDDIKYGYEGQKYPISGTYDQYIIHQAIAQLDDVFTTELTPDNIRKNSVIEIGGLNLGVEEREMPDLAIIQDMDKVEISLNNYTHTYQYAQRFEDPENYAGGDPFNVTVKFANKYSENSYSREVYPSDVIYNKQEGNEGNLKIFITYRLKIRNEASNVYANLKSLSNYYDERYENVVVRDEEGNLIQVQDDLHYNKNGLKKIKIQSNYLIESGQTREMTITYQLNNDAINTILNKDLTLDSITEITSYSSYSDKEYSIPYAGIDVDSAPDTVIPEIDESNKINIVNTIEDDTDKAPSLIIKPKEERIIKGTVWEDSAIQGLLQNSGYSKERKGNGIYEDTESIVKEAENVVKNVRVELLNVIKNQAGIDTYIPAKLYKKNEVAYKDDIVVDPAVTMTNEKGEYSFEGVIPGNYILRYTYGDTSILYDKDGNVVRDSNGNSCYIDADNYKSTIYRGGNKEAVNAMEDYWYRGETSNIEGVVRLSDAKDNENIIRTRSTEAEEITYENAIGNNGLTHISADTRKFDIKLDYDINLDNISKYSDELKFVFDNIDFGIIERPKQSLIVDKQVSNIQIMLTNGNDLINGDPRSSKMPGVKVLDDNVYIEIDNEIIQGSTLRITYEISVDNSNCEIDYNNEDYYIYGTVPIGNVGWKIARVADMFDYLPEDLVLQSTEDNNWERIKIEPNMKGKLLAEPIYEKVKGLQNIIHLKNPIFENMLPGSELVDTSMVVSKQLSMSTDDAIYQNNIEIIKLKSRTIYDSIPGNYDPTTNKSYDPYINEYTQSEFDDDNVEIIITPPTGENRIYWIYGVLGITMLIVIGVGIIIIKKKVL